MKIFFYAPLMSIVNCFSSNMCWLVCFHVYYPFAPFAFCTILPSSVGRPSVVRRTSDGRDFEKVKIFFSFGKKVRKLFSQHMSIVLGQKNVKLFNGNHAMIISFILPALETITTFTLFSSWHDIRTHPEELLAHIVWKHGILSIFYQYVSFGHNFFCSQLSSHYIEFYLKKERGVLTDEFLQFLK